MLREARRKLKFKALARRLDSEPLAVAALEMLWHATAESTPDGGIGRFDDVDIEAELGWRGDPGALVAALVETHWLDRIDGAARLYVHDWHQHADHSTQRKLARARQHFANGAPPNYSTLTEKERASAAKFYEQVESNSEPAREQPASNSRVTREQHQESLQGQGQGQSTEQKKEESARPAASLPPWALECSRLLAHLMRTSGPDGGPVPRARFPVGYETRWAKDIARMPAEIPALSANGLSPEEHIKAALRWLYGPNNLGHEYEIVVLSGKTLREKWPKYVDASARREKRSMGDLGSLARELELGI